MRVLFHASIIFLLLLPVVASAQSYSKAQKLHGERKYAEAAKEWLLLSEAGHSSAQSILADLYYQGKGVPQDYTEAAKWYLRAAEQGSPYPQMRAGEIYSKGDGVPQSDAKAIKWLTLAASQGYSPAQIVLGAILIQAAGDLQDLVAAHMWLNIAAANGSSQAGDLRDSVADVMVSTQVKEAQARARRCMESEYQNCG